MRNRKVIGRFSGTGDSYVVGFFRGRKKTQSRVRARVDTER